MILTFLTSGLTFLLVRSSNSSFYILILQSNNLCYNTMVTTCSIQIVLSYRVYFNFLPLCRYHYCWVIGLRMYHHLSQCIVTWFTPKVQSGESSLRKFYGWYHECVDFYGISASQMRIAMFQLILFWPLSPNVTYIFRRITWFVFTCSTLPCLHIRM